MIATVAKRAVLIVLSLPALVSSFNLPSHSWNTLPVAWHSAFDGPIDPADLKLLARFPLVTFEKTQGSSAYHWQHGLGSGEVCQKGVDLTACGCCAEDHIIAAAKQLKSLNSSIHVVAYMNSIISYPWYRVAQKFVTNSSWWLRNTSGGLMNNIKENPTETWYTWDFSKPAVGDLWREACINMTSSGVVDGCFMDGCSQVPSPLFKEVETKYAADKQSWMQELQGQIPGILICGSGGSTRQGVAGTQVQNWGKNGDYATREIPMLQAAVAAGKVFEAHAACGSGDPHDTVEQTKVAAFLVAAGLHSYYLCGGWSSSSIEWQPIFDMPLGEPLGNATQTDNVLTRHFSYGTVVSFDLNNNNGTIVWGHFPNSTK